MEAAFPVSASARLAGRAKTADHATNRCISACRAAPTTDTTTWKLVRAFATAIGPGMTVRRLFAAWTAAPTESASHRDAAAMRVGRALCANN